MTAVSQSWQCTAARSAIAALATGLAQGCVDESLRYAHEREAFGHPIGHYQAIQFTIADMGARAATQVFGGYGMLIARQLGL
jgi:short/branched chain acyl-CoA dehydrogenase